MAAYAAVVSVMHLMDQIQVYHARHSIFHDKQQRQLNSLREKVSFFQDFLESYSYGCNDHEAESFERRIADVAYAVEDVVESYIVNDVHARSGEKRKRKNKRIILDKLVIQVICNTKCFSRNVQTLIEYMDFIKREVMEIKGKRGVVTELQPREVEQASSSKPVSTMGMDTIVGFDVISKQIMNKLVGQQRDLQVISVTGMGGSGKSTLAKIIYDDKRIVKHFDICRWVTVSQEFNAREMLLVLLGRGIGSSSNEYHQIGEALHKMLSSRRYFIVIDDIWSLEAWDKIRLYLPNDGNGSRIMITTRLSNLASGISSSNVYMMNFLNDDESWSLLQRKVFSQESCPLELEDIGKKIAKNCKGLPLSIIVVGGLLAKSMNVEYWNSIAKDVSQNANSEENERCLKTLDLSYRHLPIHLKPCFLYFGVFPEDREIKVSRLVKLWVAEGFLKPKEGKILEDVAIDYLVDLINRNLIFVSKVGYRGQASRCKIHDLLRDLCLREGRKQGFFCAIKEPRHDISQGFSSKRRISLVNFSSTHQLSPFFIKLRKESHQLVPFIRSIACHHRHIYFDIDSLSSFDVELFRALSVCEVSFKGSFPKLFNLRYFEIYADIISVRSFPCSILQLFWNLQNIYIQFEDTVCIPSEIWEMSQLRHVNIGKFKVDDPCYKKRDGQDNIVLENLQSFSTVLDFRCSERVLRKIPNVKKLEVTYLDRGLVSDYIINIGRFTKLESLECTVKGVPKETMSQLKFSRSLKKLYLVSGKINWEDIGRNIGSLPHLEKLTLYLVRGDEEWNLVEGQFPCLKYLKLFMTNLVCWIADSVHFPSLERLELEHNEKLDEIPSGIGDIPTLQCIKVVYGSDSARASAERIREEQRSLGNENLNIIIQVMDF